MQKTENLPDTQGEDFADIAEIGGALATIGAPLIARASLLPQGGTLAAAGSAGGAILTGILQNPGFLQLILQLLQGIFNRPKPTPQPPDPVPVPTPPPQPLPPSVDPRRVASLRAKWYFIEAMLTKGTETKFGKRVIVSKPEFDKIVSGAGLLGLGYRLHIDITPYDQFGRPFLSGDPDNNRCLLIDPSAGPIEGNNRVRHNIVVDGQLYGPQGDTVPGTPWDAQDLGGLTSEYDDYACTPVITLAQDLPLSVLRTVSYRADFENPDGSIITGPTLPVLNYKPWQIPDAS